jgi:hypothetical protein
MPRAKTPSSERQGGLASVWTRKRYRETPDVTAATVRLIRSVGKRVAWEDPEDLAYLLKLDAALKEAWRTAVDGLRTHGATDRQIGQALGTTRQAVEQRWPR